MVSWDKAISLTKYKLGYTDFSILSEKELTEIVEIAARGFRRRSIGKCMRYRILSKYRWRCAICEKKLKFDINSECSGDVAEIDHIIPVDKAHEYDGLDINEPRNLQPLCKACNLWKSNRLFRRSEYESDIVRKSEQGIRTES